MPVPRDAYNDATWLYLQKSCNADSEAVLRDVGAVMNSLEGEALRAGLKQIYLKWGHHDDDEARDSFIQDMMTLADGRREPQKQAPQSTQVGAVGIGSQGALF